MLVGTLETLGALAAEAPITGPATTIIGEVVAVRDQVAGTAQSGVAHVPQAVAAAMAAAE